MNSQKDIQQRINSAAMTTRFAMEGLSLPEQLTALATTLAHISGLQADLIAANSEWLTKLAISAVSDLPKGPPQ